MPKIIHTGDIHLDAPFSLSDVQKARMRKNELRETFENLILFAKNEGNVFPYSQKKTEKTIDL